MLPALSKLVEAEYRTGCCMTMGTRPSLLFLAGDIGPPPDAAIDATMGGGYHTLSIVPYSAIISNVPPPPCGNNNGAPFPVEENR